MKVGFFKFGNFENTVLILLVFFFCNFWSTVLDTVQILVLTVDDEMTLFFNAAPRQTSGLTAFAESFALVCKSS